MSNIVLSLRNIILTLVLDFYIYKWILPAKNFSPINVRINVET